MKMIFSSNMQVFLLKFEGFFMEAEFQDRLFPGTSTCAQEAVQRAKRYQAGEHQDCSYYPKDNSERAANYSQKVQGHKHDGQANAQDFICCTNIAFHDVSYFF
jgi:hypothetical protein